jgi:charged multivesicular body protein 3
MKSISRFIYGPTPEEKVRSWQQKLRQEERQLDREVMNVRFRLQIQLTIQLERHTQKSRSELKVLAKKNDVKSARILAKEVVRANKQRDRLISSKARIGSVQMQLQHQLCTLAQEGSG